MLAEEVVVFGLFSKVTEDAWEFGSNWGEKGMACSQNAEGGLQIRHSRRVLLVLLKCELLTPSVAIISHSGQAASGDGSNGDLLQFLPKLIFCDAFAEFHD